MHILSFLFSKKDIPVTNYRMHTLHCARNMVKCQDCDMMINSEQVNAHRREFHSLVVCDQCGVSIEAFKLPEHKVNSIKNHSVWKSQKKSHSPLRAKRVMFTFWVDKSSSKMPKMANSAFFGKPVACGQIVLPDRSLLIGQIMVKMPKLKTSNATFGVIFKHYEWDQSLLNTLLNLKHNDLLPFCYHKFSGTFIQSQLFLWFAGNVSSKSFWIVEWEVSWART